MNTHFNLFFSLFIPFFSFSQNLVLNPGFEEFECKRWSISSIELCKDWSSPTLHTPDYFNNTCKKDFITSGFPDKYWWGPQLPHSGDAYAGIIAYRPVKDDPSKTIVEYLQVKLSQPLEADKKYSVSFYISLAECSSLTIKKIGTCFTNAETKENNLRALNLYPQAELEIVNDTAQWSLSEKTFTARGGEEYLIIGLFDTREKLKTNKTKPAKKIKDPRNEAYYFIDDVCVKKADEVYIPESTRSKN